MNMYYVMLVAILVCATVSGCGKSKEKLAAEAAQERLQVEAVAAAASAAELRIEAEAAAASAVAARAADLERRRVDEALILQMQTNTTQYLKDPSSAQFQNVKLNTPRTALCGQLNSKNGFGGYVGFRDFIATEAELFVKPEGCGVLSPVQMLDKSPADGVACMKYVLAISRDNLCQ